jgi:hypothetical protein
MSRKNTSNNLDIPLYERTKPCDACGRESYFENYCGAWVCAHCGKHVGLARCYCGWAANGGDGRAQLVELGENIDEDTAMADAHEGWCQLHGVDP